MDTTGIEFRFRMIWPNNIDDSVAVADIRDREMFVAVAAAIYDSWMEQIEQDLILER